MRFYVSNYNEEIFNKYIPILKKYNYEFYYEFDYDVDKQRVIHYVTINDIETLVRFISEIKSIPRYHYHLVGTMVEDGFITIIDERDC
ncbi:hypothetical protein QYF48_16275 [Brevibacillus agri]|uniref:hypothetical protein n=1 Tax=Brevibacillus agri TaxID=51101 RepID=UPI0025B6FAD3|nr:hypothetical protein [Brevibacillus agri]MDN4094366.1 hypothetical protein [Brevibacillus agri]